MYNPGNILPEFFLIKLRNCNGEKFFSINLGVVLTKILNENYYELISYIEKNKLKNKIKYLRNGNHCIIK